MTNLAVIWPENVRKYAEKKGIGIIDFPSDRLVEFELRKVGAIISGKKHWLPHIRLRNYGSMIIKLPEAIVRGRNLSVIHNNALLAGGYAHSYNWVAMGGFGLSLDRVGCVWPPTPIVEIPENTELFVIGITSHFGHFFTDCLDRLLAVDRAGMTKSARYIIDGRPPEQVRQLIELLGIDFPESNWHILDPNWDYKVKNVNVVTLCS